MARNDLDREGRGDLFVHAAVPASDIIRIQQREEGDEGNAVSPWYSV
jgi:hypothetical protein